MARHDIIVIGAGIIGLSTAHHLSRARPDLRILVVEKEDVPGKHQTSHNSGVIHAGIYYTPGSLKSRFCKIGAEETKRFCRDHGIRFDNCGKLIVATEHRELARLENLRLRAETNGLEVRVVDAVELAEIEPNVRGVRAIVSPASGIVDYGQICRVIRDRLLARGVEFRFKTSATGLHETSREVVVETNTGDIAAAMIVACCGLQADRVAHMSGLAHDFQIIPFRGEYFRLSHKAGNLVRHLIYPVPDPSLPFLGVHLTKMIGGYTTVGPNVVFSFGRETYERNSVVMSDMTRCLTFPGFWKLISRSVVPGLHELGGTLSRRVYLERCRRYCPALTLEDLESHPPGIRAQAVNRDGKMIDDFLVRQTARTLHVCNAPSPAATSAFPISAEIADQVLQKLQP